MQTTISLPDITKGAVIGSIINAMINGLKYWFTVKEMKEVMLTDNLISSTEYTVFASAVPLATSLAFFLTSISYFTLKIEAKPPYFPRVFLLALKNAIFAFGIVTIFAILLQRFAGSLSVSPITATIITGLISGMVAGMVDYLTKKEMLQK